MRFPLWKYLIILLITVISLVFALPNMYPDVPAIQISGNKAGTAVDPLLIKQVENALRQHHIPLKETSQTATSALIRVDTSENQLKAKDIALSTLGNQYTVALNLAPTTPKWLSAFGAKPMKLGLDLRGGVHFTLEVDIKKALEQRLETTTTDVRRLLREEDVDSPSIQKQPQGLRLLFTSTESRDKARSLIQSRLPEFTLNARASNEGALLNMEYSQAQIDKMSAEAVEQNLITMRKRINELGVAEAVAQRQGNNRITVDLPGVQDTAEAKRVIGSTANLEFRMVADTDSSFTGGTAPIGTEAFPFGSVEGPTVLLNRQIILTGERIQNASDQLDQNSRPSVSINLDSKGGRLMASATQTRVGKQMAVVFIENKQREVAQTDPVTGKITTVKEQYADKYVINRATIQDILGSQFQITGLNSTEEAKELALLLRAGSLAAPMYFVEERTIGPSLGQENIDKGINSTLVGFALVALFMVVFYKLFGLIANLALFLNVAMIMALMSLMGAALSLPGIAGIVLTIGMAVDANVLIFERIKEELKMGASPRAAINAGYDRAFTTILDSNLTTLIVAVILFAIGTGPIKGFAVTLMIGILCSMFTAITGTRGIVELIYGRKARINTLSI